MNYKVIYSDESLGDIIRIYDYISIVRNESVNAIRLIDAIRNSIKNLYEFPFSHPIVSFSPWKEIGMRYLTVKKHIVFYCVNEKQSVVNIIRIFSSKQDIKNIIND